MKPTQPKIDKSIKFLKGGKCKHRYLPSLGHIEMSNYNGEIEIGIPEMVFECIDCGMIKTE